MWANSILQPISPKSDRFSANFRALGLKICLIAFYNPQFTICSNIYLVTSDLLQILHTTNIVPILYVCQVWSRSQHSKPQRPVTSQGHKWFSNFINHSQISQTYWTLSKVFFKKKINLIVLLNTEIPTTPATMIPARQHHNSLVPLIQYSSNF